MNVLMLRQSRPQGAYSQAAHFSIPHWHSWRNCFLFLCSSFLTWRTGSEFLQLLSCCPQIFSERLPCTRHRTLQTPSNPVRQPLSLSPFYRRGSRFRGTTLVYQPVSGGASIQTQAVWLRAPALAPVLPALPDPSPLQEGMWRAKEWGA